MFSGIVTDVGQVRSVAKGGDVRYEIETAYDTGAIAIGASIACAGVCLSVIDKGPEWFAVEASRETLARTTLETWQMGTSVNLEQSLRLGDRLDGHLVMGHVDGTAVITDRRVEVDSVGFSIEVPDSLMRFIAPKGAVVLDGVSLTVNEVDGTKFTTNVIPHTQKVTTLGGAQAETRLNMEIDVIARYIARLIERE